jgi:CRP-like cAMP-binding protein
LHSLLSCLAATESRFAKGSFIFLTESKVTSVGIVLSGGVHLLQEDFWGNRRLLEHIEPGGIFGETFSCAGVEKLPVSAVSAEKSNILLLDYKKIITTCSSTCFFHTALIKNMLRIIAQKNILLLQKMGHLTRHTTREKLLSYLSEQAQRANSTCFAIPFNRQELADYLSVDRSAMSSELAKMRSEDILSFSKNNFELLKSI